MILDNSCAQHLYHTYVRVCTGVGVCVCAVDLVTYRMPAALTADAAVLGVFQVHPEQGACVLLGCPARR